MHKDPNLARLKIALNESMIAFVLEGKAKDVIKAKKD